MYRSTIMRRIYHFPLCLLFSFFMLGCSANHRADHYAIITTSVVKDKLLESSEQEGHLIVKRKTDDALAKEMSALLDMPVYGVESRGFCPGGRYSYYNVNMEGGIVYFDDCMADDEGELIFVRNSVPLWQNYQFFGGYMNGESVSFAVVSNDGQSCTTATFVPKPIECTWRDGAYASLQMLDRNARDFRLACKGFKPNEPLLLTWRHGDTRDNMNVQTSAEGKIFVKVRMGSDDVKGGNAVYTVTRLLMNEDGTMHFAWGSAAKDTNQAMQQKE